MAKPTTISLIVKLAIRLITTSRVSPLSPTNPSMVMVSQQPSSQWASKGLEYVESLKGTDAIFVTKDDKVYISKDIEGNFEIGKDSGYTMGNRADLK